MGRWIKAQEPLILLGKRAASLSSGDMTTPSFSNTRKSFVSARDTPGPPREYEVYATAYCWSSGIYVMRGSSTPHNSSGNRSTSGRNVGSRSICHPSTPFAERATHKCESPRRSSTPQHRQVQPPGSTLTPALKTPLIDHVQ